MNQINVVPFIDVMLVLLIVFMIATPSMRTGEIELPSVGQTLTLTPGEPIEIVVRANGNITVREAGDTRLSRDNAVKRIIELQRVRDRPVVIAADKAVRYEEVVNLLGALHAAGVKRVGLAAREGN
ncbi:MAG: biopolymer transporter ExbD [Casimicrobium sp.]